MRELKRTAVADKYHEETYLVRKHQNQQKKPKLFFVNITQKSLKNREYLQMNADFGRLCENT